MRRNLARTAGSLLAVGALVSTAAACGGSSNNNGSSSSGPGTGVPKQGKPPRGGAPQNVAQALVSTAGDPAALPNDKTATDDLAQSHTVSPDGKTYTFTLRDGVHYSGPTT